MWDILYRPRKYSDVIGQDGCVRLLRTRISRGTAFDTSYLFAGEFGLGKTTLARIHARAMLCQDLDKHDPEPCGKCDSCRSILNEQSEAFTERDAASSGSTDQMRALVEELPYVLSNALKRIYLIDECQRLHQAAQDVLLKPMEEKKMVAMLCTTEAEKIRAAIRSRCEEYTIRKVTRDDILPRMKMVLNEQGVTFEDDAVLIVIDQAQGHIRNVLNSLEMVAQLGPVTVESVREYLNLSVVTLYYQILLNLDKPLKAIEYLGQACESVAPNEVAQGLAEAAMNSYRLANKWFADFSYVDRELAGQVYTKYHDHVLRFAKWFLGHRNVTRLTLELDILAFSQNAGALPPESLAPPVMLVSQGVRPAGQPEVQVAAVEQETTSKTSPEPMVAVPSAVSTVVLDYSSPDPSPCTPLEGRAVSVEYPRQRHRENDGESEGARTNAAKTVDPGEWRMYFEQHLRKRLEADEN